ncbi:MAG TPA: NYN domain-containing protein [Sedimentisphaerales bacterium]|nr:NYN domain-containing protein [Sedimentisphaerales bacterium]HRS13367.1 NYN domain-containing protein [Sedimentisphaerales bacterium]
MKPRTIVYVDGFNFYYGAVRGTPHKWLDLEKCFLRLRPADDIRRIWYFTALVDGAKGARQQAYLQALATRPLVQVMLGKFKLKQIKCAVPGCSYPGSRVFDVPEEKRTDVNIALQLLNDANHDHADQFIIVSGDSDLVPALETVKTQWPAKRLTVYVPSRHPLRGAAVELRSAADKHRTFPQALLKVCQFPPELPDGRGGLIRKPDRW